MHHSIRYGITSMSRQLLVVVVVIAVIFGAQLSTVPVQASGPYLDLGALPVIPSISGAVANHARSLARHGKRIGNRMDVFTKVGDSITRWTFFLVPVGQGQVQLGQYGDLAGVIGRFSRRVARTGNSFANDSLAAHDMWNSADVLNPQMARGGVCNAGETPLDCELRVTKPGVALIMIGTNDLVFDDVNTFRANLNRIVSVVEAHSVIPVVSTIPYRRDNPAFQDRVAAYNEIIAQVAYAHSVPVWNYWLAVAGLPANGVSNDGIHPSVPPDGMVAFFDPNHLQFGFTVRNLTALQVLKSLMPVLY